MLPRWTGKLLVILAILGMIPFALIARARVSTSEKPRIHVIHDMDHQDKYKPQSKNPLFADGRAMRPPVPGTVAQGELMLDDHLYRGLTDRDEWADGLPEQVPFTMTTLRRGQERFNVYCAVCHGHSGKGDGMVARRAEQLATLGRSGMEWVPPTNVNELRLLDPAHLEALGADAQGVEEGYLYHVIKNGIRNMPAYGPQISVEDRWAIVAYVRALQRSQHPIGPGDASGRTAPPSGGSVEEPEQGEEGGQ